MTIDEAIKHCEEVAEHNETKALRIGRQYEGTLLDREAKECRECASDHRQLAEWLTDYKELKNSIGAIKLSNMKETLALIRTLKAELNGWKEDPFGIIAEECRTRSCKLCQWEEKCPYAGTYEYHPEDWRIENEN